MLTTTVFLTLFAGTFLAKLALEAAILWVAARVAQIEGATAKRVVSAIVLIAVANVAVLALAWLTDAVVPGLATLLAIRVLLVSFAAPIIIVAYVLRTKWWKSLLIWIPTIAASFIVQSLLADGIRSHVVEAFTLSSNSMAPTLLGPHWKGVCQECGGPAVGSVEPLFDGEPPPPQLMICVDNFHETVVDKFDTEVHPQDRIIVSKYLSPQRWDMIVFRYPEDPSTNYVMRLVGLPGEEVVIRDGAVWINGKKQPLPDHLRGLTYVTEIEPFVDQMAGTEAFPAPLGDDEYFVLGDFSSRSKDSRLWYEGAAGHPAYAVPADHLVGVVTQIYWPPSRWRVFR